MVIAATLFASPAMACADQARAVAFDARAMEAYDQGNSVLAAVLWRQAAHAGGRDAMTALGGLLEAGDGVARARPDQARRWYTRAAGRGEPHAMVLLAEERLSANPADEQGLSLMRRAAALGHELAIRRLAALSGETGVHSYDSKGDLK